MLIVEQSLNGVEFGLTLFLLAAGLTLVLGIMRFINLAHGSFYMIGAFIAATTQTIVHSYLLSLVVACLMTAAVGLLTERIVFRTLYERGPLDQVIVTYGIVMFFNEMVRIIFGNLPLSISLPNIMANSVQFSAGFSYPIFRLVISGVGVAVAFGLYFLVNRTRAGMLIRAGASDRSMIQALGIRINLLFALVFAFGVGLAAVAGALAGALYGVQVGMGDNILILTLMVIVIGGIGSIEGAFVGALLVGVVDTFGQVMLPPTLASISVYILMAVVLFWRPRGLFPVYG